LYEQGVLTSSEFGDAICKCCKDFPPNVGEGLDALIRAREREVIDSSVLCEALTSYLAYFPEQKEQALQVLSNHPHAEVHKLGSWFRGYIRTEELSRDFDHLRRTSALQPGRRLRLFGGYESCYRPPWWLNGREYYKATFIGFGGCRIGRRPLAFIELDEEIDVISGAGREYKGRYAVLNSFLGPGIDPHREPLVAWGTEATVEIHIVHTLPQDAEAFSSYDVLCTESAIETHATYRVVDEDLPSGAGFLHSLAKELGQAIDALDDERTAAIAAQSVRGLLCRPPALLLTVIPALIQRLRSGGGTGATVRSLLLELGDPALRVLIANLSCEDTRLRSEVASTIEAFGPGARAALPEQAKSLQAQQLQR